MPIKIYKSDISPPVRAVLMTAEYIKLKYEAQEINMSQADHKTAEYSEKNPLQTIPMIEDGDFVLSDSHAIITYLVSKYGAEKRAELYPNDLAIRATVTQRLFFEATMVFGPLKTIAVGLIHENSPGPNVKQIQEMHETYSVLEKYLEKTKFVACDNVTLADVSLISSIPSIHHLIPIDEKYVKIHAWWNKLKEEEWYQTGNQPGLTNYENLINMLLEMRRK